MFKDLVDDVLGRLQDNGTLFSRDEIMRWLSASYRRLTSQGRHVRTFTALDVPPRHARAITFSWEKNQGLGTWRKWTYSHAGSEYTSLWEIEHTAGMEPTPGTANVSNLWEMAHSDSTVDTHYRFMLPKAEASIISVWQDHDYLSPVTARQLDSLMDRWWMIGGQTYAWHQTLGDESSFEVWETDSTYHQSFEYPDGDIGNPRSWMEDEHLFGIQSETATWGYAYSWSGEPQAATSFAGLGYQFTYGPTEDGFHYTFPWEVDPDSTEEVVEVFTNHWEGLEFLEVGIFRGAYSEHRQYFAAGQWMVNGTVRSLGKSDDGILVYHHVHAADTVNEDEAPVMMPPQMAKYLVYDALATLLNRQGEGYDPALAAHYELRAARGLQVLRKLGMVTRVDASYTRGSGRAYRSQPPLPQLPSNFPRAPWLRR